MILTYDHFIKPLTLLLLLIRRYYTPQPFMMTSEEYNRFKTHYSCTRRKRTIELLAYWIQHRSSDFTTNSDLLALLVIFFESISKYEKECASSKDFANLYAKVEALIQVSNEKVKKELIRPSRRKIERVQTSFGAQPKIIDSVPLRHTYDTPQVVVCNGRKDTKTSRKSSDRISECDDSESPTPKPSLGPLGRSAKPSNFTQRLKRLAYNDQYLILEWDAKVIAEQLTLIDNKQFKKIQINQMMKKKWTNTAFLEDCKEIHKVIGRFNSLSFWIQYIIVNAADICQRTELLNKFITIATECLKLQNFMSSHSIFTAFLRIQNTKLWNIYPDNEEDWKALETIYKSPCFFQDMEDTLKSLVPPAVPGIPFFTNRFFRLQDNVNFLTKLEQQNKYLKSIQLGQLAEYSLLVIKFQGKMYEIEKNKEMYGFFKRDYKMKFDIDFDSDEAEVMIRMKIMEVTEDLEN